MQGPSSFTNIVANVVVVAGANGGLFFYSGTPQAGNLIMAVTGADGTDQYGNAYKAVFSAGALAGAFTQIDASGNMILYNTSGLPVIVLNPVKQSILIYSPSAGAGNLISSVAAAAGTDQYGNAYSGGISALTTTTDTRSQAMFAKSTSPNTHALTAFQADTTGTANAAINAVSGNPNFTAVEVTGNELGRGTIKVTHQGYAAGTDAGAAALSIDLKTVNGGVTGTKAGGIFITSTTDNPYSAGADMLNVRIDNTETVIKTTADGPKMGISVPVTHVPSAMLEIDLVGTETHHLDLRDNVAAHCYLYTLNGALVYQGALGTITTIAPSLCLSGSAAGFTFTAEDAILLSR